MTLRLCADGEDGPDPGGDWRALLGAGGRQAVPGRAQTAGAHPMHAVTHIYQLVVLLLLLLLPLPLLLH